MKIKPKTDDPNYVRILSIQQSVISSTFSMVSKIDADRLRGTQKDEFEDILAAIKREQEKAPAAAHAAGVA